MQRVQHEISVIQILACAFVWRTLQVLAVMIVMMDIIAFQNVQVSF